MKHIHLAISLLVLASIPAVSQDVSGAAFSDATVLLEPHDGQTRFTIGDLIVVDLVFASTKPGYAVEADFNPYLPSRDEIDVSPDGGWVRTHSALFGQSINGNAFVRLEDGAVRVPILINRSIRFEAPGHYEITVVTDRLYPVDGTAMATTDDCSHCRKSNALGIDIEEPVGLAEPLLVSSLTHILEQTAPHGLTPEPPLAPEDEAQLEAELANPNPNPSSEERQKLEALNKKIEATVRESERREQERLRSRREAAERIAYLSCDEAMRAKVSFIVADPENGEPDSVGAIMVDGLPNSDNLQLQLTLLEEAWRNPQHVPTYLLERALNQARELVRSGTVTEEPLRFAGTPEESKAAGDEYRNDLNEIVATLPLRRGENRTRTIDFLKKSGVKISPSVQ